MARLPRDIRPTPMTIRSRLILEIASELVSRSDQPNGQVKVLLRPQGGSDWPLTLFGSSTVEGVTEVVNGDVALAIVNPSSALTLAHRGNGPFTAPQPVSTIAVIPSRDLCVFAVSNDTGLKTIEDIAEQRYPLKLALRGQLDHWLHPLFDDLIKAAGFTLEDLESWGGEFKRQGHIPNPDSDKFQSLVRGDIDAIFDESAYNWCNDAPGAGMTILDMSEDTMAKLVAMGYRRDMLSTDEFPNLPHDILTLDFSGWPIFVREDAPDELVTQICQGLEARKDSIPWQEAGALPLDRMCADDSYAPVDVPLHPAAARFWKSLGYKT